MSNAFDDLIDSDEDDVVDDVASEVNTNDLQETSIISSEHQDSGRSEIFNLITVRRQNSTAAAKVARSSVYSLI